MSCRISEVVEYVGQKTVATSKVTMSLVFRPPKPRDLSQVQFEEIVVAGYKFMIGKGGVRRSRHDDLLEKIHQDPICLEAVHRLQRLLLDKGYYMVDDFIIVKHALDNPRKDDAEVHAAFMNMITVFQDRTEFTGRDYNILLDFSGICSKDYNTKNEQLF